MGKKKPVKKKPVKRKRVKKKIVKRKLTKREKQLYDLGVIEGFRRSHELLMDKACDAFRSYRAGDDETAKSLKRAASIVGSAGGRLQIELDRGEEK